jgi:hypothetical protein
MYQPGEEYSQLSGADLSLKKYYIAKTHTDGTIILATAATDAIIGVIHDGGRVSGDTVSVQSINGTGTFKVIAGGAITKDAYLTTDGNGKAVVTTSTGNRVFGRAIAAADSGDIFEYAKYNEKY